mgnify:FL=1
MICFSLIYFLINSLLISSQSLPLVLLISFDGFRFDYPIIHGPLENFSRLKQRGVHAPSMTSTFHTGTLPNDYTYDVFILIFLLKKYLNIDIY